VLKSAVCEGGSSEAHAGSTHLPLYFKRTKFSIVTEKGINKKCLRALNSTTAGCLILKPLVIESVVVL
jgi:hypothetical protein